MSLLIINRTDSKCDECGRSCDPHEKSHETNLGWNDEIRAQPGCGTTYTQVSSDYMGMDETVQRMRPDLEWVSVFDRPWKA